MTAAAEVQNTSDSRRSERSDSTDKIAKLTQASKVLHDVWGYDAFRPLQEDAIGNITGGQDSVVVLPTGGGKSLCYQVPALISDGMAVVVSPLISLMKDQVDALRTAGVDAAMINSTLDSSEKVDIANRIRRGEIKILYLSPERLLAPQTLDFIASQKLSFVAIDEAHCVSQWGHDFRPEYRQLNVLKKRCPGISVHAFTATASQKVRDDIAAQLGLQNHRLLVGNFDRPNLSYRMMRSANRNQQILDVLSDHQGESGIVYAITRREVDELTQMLIRSGINAVPYHAGLDDIQRRENQDAFIKETVDVVVATVAFGMGIDKANVRFVVHAGMPKSIEHYQQESGRAGRDGLPADCVLIYGGGDVMTWKRILENGDPSNFDNAMRSVNQMAEVCSGVRCRHAQLVEHFGQEYDCDNCNACDVCLGQIDLVEDPLVLAQKIMSSVIRQEERFGAAYTAKVLRGVADQRVVQNGHDKISTYGLLQGQSENAIRTWIDQLISQQLLIRSGEYQTLKLTPKGREVLRGQGDVRLTKISAASKASRQADVSWQGVNRGLFDHLRSCRSDLATEQSVPAYVIFNDHVLRQLAAIRPTKMETFGTINGVGAKKLEAFGGLFLSEVDQYCKDNGLSRDQAIEDTTQVSTPAPRRPRSSEEASTMFAAGDSVDQVAQALNRAVSTVNGYLQNYLRDEGITDPKPWVETDEIERIQQAILEVQNESPGSKQLRPIYEKLDEAISYNDIRVVLTCQKNAQEMESS